MAGAVEMTRRDLTPAEPRAAAGRAKDAPAPGRKGRDGRGAAGQARVPRESWVAWRIHVIGISGVSDAGCCLRAS